MLDKTGYLTQFGRNGRAFTLVELLVVITIIAILALVGVLGSSKIIERGRKIQTVAQFRDFEVGLRMYETDYNRPPIPETKRNEGWDTMYSDPGGKYSNSILIAVLAGEEGDFPAIGSDEIFNARQMNPKQEKYIEFPFSANRKSGVGDDGKLYDPWGREVIVIVNGGQGSIPDDPITQGVGATPGKNDTHLESWGFGAYTETKPKEQSYVFISYGTDGRKGDNAPNYWDLVPYSGSDDVISW
jgi:prepilin-type N-terminal cleavage/methylation domain-containing protein